MKEGRREGGKGGKEGRSEGGRGGERERGRWEACTYNVKAS